MIPTFPTTSSAPDALVILTSSSSFCSSSCCCCWAVIPARRASPASEADCAAHRVGLELHRSPLLPTTHQVLPNVNEFLFFNCIFCTTIRKNKIPSAQSGFQISCLLKPNIGSVFWEKRSAGTACLPCPLHGAACALAPWRTVPLVDKVGALSLLKRRGLGLKPRGSG